jgi:hypothetical protein
MKAGSIIFSLAGLALLAASAAHAQQAGDWVLARWTGGEYWFPGVVAERSGAQITVAYDDGTRETLPAALVRPYDWRVGSRVQCRWQGGAQWYAGRITSIDRDGVSLAVTYEDGDSELTRSGACRAQQIGLLQPE